MRSRAIMRVAGFLDFSFMRQNRFPVVLYIKAS
jgi:hypothetical protein